MYINNNLKWQETRTSLEGGTCTCLMLTSAVAQKQSWSLCEMRKANIWHPQRVSKFYEIVGSDEYYNEQGTQDNNHGVCWTRTILLFHYCFTLDSSSRHNVHTMAPHSSMTRHGFSQRALSNFYQTMSTSYIYLTLKSFYGDVSLFLCEILTHIKYHGICSVCSVDVTT